MLKSTYTYNGLEQVAIRVTTNMTRALVRGGPSSRYTDTTRKGAQQPNFTTDATAASVETTLMSKFTGSQKPSGPVRLLNAANGTCAGFALRAGLRSRPMNFLKINKL